jgi:CheY-like chemotaxis protein
MIVDDEPFNLLALEGLFRVIGLTNIQDKVVRGYNGLEAVQHIKDAIKENDPYRYSLIITDCSMPFLDGYCAAR